MDDFYVYLPANVNSVYFENTSANYKTKLVQHLSLKGLYEVGLAEISYTYSFNNIYQDENISISYINSSNKIEKIEFTLRKGYYTIEDLVKTINGLVKLQYNYELLPNLEIITERLYKRIRLNFGSYENGYIFMQMSQNLCDILGFNKDDLDRAINRGLSTYVGSYRLINILKEKPGLWVGQVHLNTQDIEKIKEYLKVKIKANYTAERTYNISCGLQTIFVYCDIIKPHIVGNTITPLLKFVEIPNRITFGQQVHLIYDNIQYYSLQTNEFESIEIDLKDDSGMNIPFEYAKNVVVLHFRKKHNKSNDVITREND